MFAQCVDVDVCLYYAAVQILVYRGGNVPQVTAKNTSTPPIYCAQLVKKFVDISIQLPARLQSDPVQMAEVVQREYVLVGGAWLCPRLNVAESKQKA